MDGTFLAQRPMGPRPIVVVGVAPNDPAQISFTRDDNAVETLSSDRADQALSVTICHGDLGAVG